jgi:hypothetical protein
MHRACAIFLSNNMYIVLKVGSSTKTCNEGVTKKKRTYEAAEVW